MHQTILARASKFCCSTNSSLALATTDKPSPLPNYCGTCDLQSVASVAQTNDSPWGKVRTTWWIVQKIERLINIVYHVVLVWGPQWSLVYLCVLYYFIVYL
jgi:hypothetical protein